jgi:hypothetical protein
VSQAEEPTRGVYTGNSSAEETLLGEPEGPTLEKALRNAYTKARQGKPPGPKTFRVVEIRVKGDNPPSDYIVELVDDD